MAVISITISDAAAARLISAAGRAGHPATAAGVQAWIKDWVRETVLASERAKVQADATATIPATDPDFPKP